MKTIFLGEKSEKLSYVYPDAVVSRIADLAETDKTYYNKEYVMTHPSQFADTEYIFSTWSMPVMTEEEIAACFPALRAVFYAAGSVQAFARPFLARGVKVFSAWAANAVPVAEYTVAQIVLANKGFFAASRLAKTGDRASAKACFARYPGNYGVKIGIIGAGMIGKLVIERLKDYRMEVLVFDPFLPDETADALGVKKVDLPTLFAECEVISNHLANNAQTQGMLGGEHFLAMLPYATFLNTGRGAQVREQELCDALRSRPDLTAVLDVTYPEPPLSDSPFYTLENCILTPHIAGSSGREVHRMAEYMAEEFECLLSGAPTRYAVTEKMLETMA